MTNTSKEKLLKTGWVLYRKLNSKGKYGIMQCKELGVWSMLNSYDTKTPRDMQLEMIDGLDNTIVLSND